MRKQTSSNRSDSLLLLALSAATGILASIPYLVPHCGFISLFAFVPLLCMERIADLSGRRTVWPFYYLSFVIWNAISTFWVCNATVGGGLFAIFANAFQMALIFALFRWIKTIAKGIVPYIFLASAWLAWEHFYFDAAISWPWLVLGNSFAGSVRSIQWYEYTGALGGSLWIWTVNIFIFSIMVSLSDGSASRWNIKARIAAFGGLIAVIALPFAVSAWMFSSYEEKNDPVVAVALQPNIDPYNKFGGMTQEQQTAQLLEIAGGIMDSSVNLAVAPETFTPDVITSAPTAGRTISSIISFMKDYPGAEFITGASSYTIYPKGERPSYLARQHGEGWIESHNSALIVNGEGDYDIYHKMKLVPGVEGMPYPKIFDPIDKALGGVIGRLVIQDSISTLHCSEEGLNVGCAICYESVYGDFCRGYVLDGAEVLAVITNDAWWGDTPGYRQHLRYASLRAIETRRSIVRSANTGISALINQKGEIIQQTEWWKPAAIKGVINKNDTRTFFVRNGDIIGRAATFAWMLLMAMGVVRTILSKSEGRKAARKS